MTAELDRRAELRMLAAYTPVQIARALSEAAAAGAQAGAPILRAAAPVGRGKLDARYRREGLRHGTFRGTVRAAAIHRVGPAGETGQVVGPMGRHAFVRGWIERRTRWGAHAAGRVEVAMRAASDRVLVRYAEARR